MMRSFEMTDERIDALLRRLDVTFDPDPEYVGSTYASLLPRARAARVSDTRWIGRLARDFRLVVAGVRWPSTTRPMGMVGLVVLLMVATLMALAIVGALNRTIQNGPLIVSIHGELQAIDPLSGSARKILPPGDYARGVSRSPDGRLVAFWTIGGGRSHLYVVGVDGSHQREIGSDLRLGWTDSIDVWSSDSRFLATEVRLRIQTSATQAGALDIEQPRIIVADVVTGAARVVTPPGLIAHSPLWSPDDRWIAFAEEAGTVTSLAVIRTDGSGMRTIEGTSGAAGPDTWSTDGTWIYFGVGSGRIYRANVAGGYTQQLTGDDLAAYAPASSPDGTLVAFIVDRNHDHWDLFVANSDGTGAHRVLEYAENDGWSADSRFVLAQWNPTDQPGGLAVVKPDGSEFRVVMPFDALCSQPGGPSTCTDGVGWGQARP
jgi:Tol biopolymer transport system component